VGQMATVAYAQLDLRAGELHYACAGHPPPALVAPGGAPRFLMEGRSLPLGAFLRPRPRDEATVALGPSSAVVLYTDGLIERRDESLDTGLDRLLEVLGGVDVGSGDLADGVMGTMMGREARADDVCVLVAVRR
jgi:serine phosphatase RsbU (regulator of sigma subunit)